MRKFFTLLGISILSVAFLQAQTKVVTGTVIGPDGPVDRAAVTSSAGKKVLTNENGVFSIAAELGSELSVTARGLLPGTIRVIDAPMTINLAPDLKNSNLAEVTVGTTLGSRVNTRTLGVAVTKIKSSELTQAKAVNLQNGLTGKVSGLNVSTTNSGVYGNNTRITIRGIRSLTGNNQAMLVLDGVPVDLGFLNSINPNDIADVSILKSGPAAAIYGPDAVNGAIVITTKKGNVARPVINFSHTTQLETVSYLPKFQGLFGGGYTPDINGYGVFEPIEQQSWGDKFDGSIRQYGQTGPNGEKLEMPHSYVKNGRRNFFETGVTHQTDISYSAGDFYLSAQNVSIAGTLGGDKNDRRTITMQSRKKYGKFSAEFDVRYTNAQYDVTYNNRQIYYNVTGTPGNYDLRRFKNWRTDYFSSPDGYFTPYLDNVGKTPYFAKDNYRLYGRTDDLIGTGLLTFSPTKNIDVVYRAAYTYGSTSERFQNGPFQYSAYHLTLRDHGSLNIVSSTTNDNEIKRRVTSEFFIKYRPKITDDINANITLGQTFRQLSTDFTRVGAPSLGQSSFLTPALRLGEPTVSTLTNNRNNLERYFGQADFNYKNWANLQVSASYDFDSRLWNPNKPPAKKSDFGFFYPSINGAVVLSDAIDWFKDNKTISYFKLRGAYGKTGNVNAERYAFQPTFGLGTFFPYGNILGFNPTSLTVSENLKPEFVTTTEAGFDLGLWKNRVNLEFSYYNQLNTDQILNGQLSNTTGFTRSRANYANFKNYGYEIDLSLTPLFKLGDVTMNAKINFSQNKNQILSLINGINELSIGNYNWAIVGQPAFVFKLPDYERDPQGRVIVGTDGMPTLAANEKVFGRTTPQDFLGINFNINWKGLSLSATADYRGGGFMVSDELGGFLDDNGISARSAQNDRRAFIFPNSVYWDGSKYVPNTDRYTALYGRLFWNSSLNTRAISNYYSSADFWKLRELALSYNLPVSKISPKIARTVKAVNLTLSGRNLLMFVPESNQWTDPEFVGGNGNFANNGNATGRNTAFNMPPTRIYGATLSVSF